jgi:quinone-modifying oxidoreductase subunit QmoB
VGGSVRADVDLLILSEDMLPASASAHPSGSLNLVYLQGKELPATQFGFADSHFICFPYETRRTGIYSAGAARQAMDLASSARDGAAAALKAIQSIEKSSAGAAVHPRSGDLTYPKFFMQKCTSCGRCTQECPFGALELDEKSRPVLDPNRCRRCGICMGACPVQIISFDDYSVDILAAMIKSVEIPDDSEKPRILLLACENDAYPALDMAGILRLQYAASVRVIPVRCMGSVNSILIADAVSRGFDGVALMGCKSGEDYQCHFIRGSELLATRMQNVRETLDRLALEAERVRVLEVAISDAHKIPALIEDFAQTIQRVGPNPMKGFE